MKKLLLLIPAVALLMAQQPTRISINQQIKAPAATSILAVSPSGAIALLQPDASIVIDFAAGTIKAVTTATIKLPTLVVEAQGVTGATQGFMPSAPMAPGHPLKVYRNGLLQTLGPDYTFAANTVNFTAAANLTVGDTVTLEFWK